MAGTGLKKCKPTTRSGPLAAEAMAVTGNDEVLVARMASGRAAFDNLANKSFLSCKSSGAASMIRSARAAAVSSSLAAARRSSALFRSCAVQRPFSTARPSESAMRSSAFCAAPAATSNSSVR